VGLVQRTASFKLNVSEWCNSTLLQIDYCALFRNLTEQHL
jgi:hypothetical protein